ncbi:ferrous iron transport protein A [Ornithinicoccus hortensis]|uniref:Histone acetyltransferase Rv0428c-like SH3 domain-containing protein n=1 Tax=Ornithinicoccus hortensis TaxID=82346 RepID=A0A542YN41_9MICO|nr:ferrous iron transport protein A [Ornithinicoccus hortensis]TQL49518.1 hypothetical protein FB467_0591 [Ornithinicoccus hortensis]
MAREWLTDVPVGTRVVVRYLIEGGERATDALGELTGRDEEHLVVDTRRAGPVRIALAGVVAAKPVPPAPPPRRRRP